MLSNYLFLPLQRLGKIPETEEAFRALSFILKSSKFLWKDEDKTARLLYVERSHTAYASMFATYMA